MENNYCKKCGKEINENDSGIYDGFCEKCYNKWINKKENKYINKDKNKDSHFYIFTIIALFLGVASISVSIGMLSVLPILPVLALASYSSNEFDVIMCCIIFSQIFTFLFNLFAITKEKNECTKIGLILSTIAAIILGFCFLTL